VCSNDINGGNFKSFEQPKNSKVFPTSEPINFAAGNLPIGSSPEYSLPDDSVVETKSQQLLIFTHFSLFTYNMYLVLVSVTQSLSLPNILMYGLLALGSYVLGDFVVIFLSISFSVKLTEYI
jgi:hypothetical protein